MDFKEKKEIKDKKNEIELLKENINQNLERINDSVIYNNIYFILDDIDNNFAINKFSMSSLFDYSEPTYKESKDYVENNLEFIMKLKLNDVVNYIGNDFKDIFKNISISVNLDCIQNLTFDDDNIELDLYNLDINEILDYFNNNVCGYDYLDYLDYLDKIYNFYDSLNDYVVNMINNYGKYIC